MILVAIEAFAGDLRHSTSVSFPGDLISFHFGIRVRVSIQLSPSESVESGGYIPRQFASPCISTIIRLNFGG